MKRVLVTGAGGYIGSVLTRMLLDEGYSVVALDRFFFGRDTLPDADGRLEILRADIRWINEQWPENINAVIDLAALSNDPAGELEPSKTWEINHAARVRVARLAKERGAERYVLPSSCSVYGFQEGLLDETATVNPLTTYSKANYRAEQDILPLADDDFCVVVVRQATVFGLSHRMRFDLAINGMVRGMFLNGKIPILRDGNQWRPFVHVRDTSRAMIRILETPSGRVNGETFNIGSNEQNCQILPLAKTVAEAMGVPFEFEWYGLPDYRSYTVSFAKARDVLGYTTTLSPADGAREVHKALLDGTVDANDPKTITVQWYKTLMEMQSFLKEIVICGVLV